MAPQANRNTLSISLDETQPFQTTIGFNRLTLDGSPPLPIRTILLVFFIPFKTIIYIEYLMHIHEKAVDQSEHPMLITPRTVD